MKTFYLGAKQPRWIERGYGVPWFVSARSLGEYKRRGDSMPKGKCIWALDSGGFTELQTYGTWEMDADTYGGMVTRFMMDVGPMQFAAPQDWMCERIVIEGGTNAQGVTFKGTKLTVLDHQELTVENFVYLRREFDHVPWIPVVQGDTLRDYERIVEMYRKAGVDLRAEHLVGLGSVCRRQATSEILAIVQMLHGMGLKLHGFGVKTDGLAKYGHLLESADSMAWSQTARRERTMLPGCDHRFEKGPKKGQPSDCRNCVLWAVEWRRRVLAGYDTAVDNRADAERGLIPLW